MKRCPSLLSTYWIYTTCAGRHQHLHGNKPQSHSSQNQVPRMIHLTQPIALTSCIGKVYTTIIKDRWLSFMQSNHYFDTSTQKAFMPSVPGCIEHYAKLSAAIGEAHKHHKSLCACWLDLANAYGSVHHGLINFSLNHYHAIDLGWSITSTVT